MKIDVMVTVDQTALERLTDADLRKFLERQGANMVAQVRKNIVAKGGSAEWPPLSGYNEARDERKRVRLEKSLERDRLKREREQAREARREKADQRRSRRLGDEG